MDSSDGHHQDMESLLACTKQGQERKPRPQPDQALKCPRCDSTNTKFCYYNNYSLSQPRYFCKSCRRYWTKGGTLRNVPVGGGCRKNKRSCPPPAKRLQDPSLIPAGNHHPLPSMAYDSHDLSLAFARLQKQANPNLDQELSMFTNPNAISSPAFLDAIRTGYIDNHGNMLQNFYYENAAVGDVESSGQMMLPYEDVSTPAVTVTAMKQELCNAREESENRYMWGFPWQHMNGGAPVIGGDFDSGRESWNGINATWHGLLNSALM